MLAGSITWTVLGIQDLQPMHLVAALDLALSSNDRDTAVRELSFFTAACGCATGQSAHKTVSTPLQEVCKWRLEGVLLRCWGSCRGMDGIPRRRPHREGPSAGTGFQLPHVSAGGAEQAQPLLMPAALPLLTAPFHSGASSPPSRGTGVERTRVQYR